MNASISSRVGTKHRELVLGKESDKRFSRSYELIA